MCNDTGAPVYRLVTGNPRNGKFERTYYAGQAFFVAEGQYYLLRLILFPGVNFFLKKQPNSQDGYTIYSEYHRESQTRPFQLPVGYARLSPKLKTHLEIRFGLITRPIFMDLYPAHA